MGYALFCVCIRTCVCVCVRDKRHRERFKQIMSKSLNPFLRQPGLLGRVTKVLFHSLSGRYICSRVEYCLIIWNCSRFKTFPDCKVLHDSSSNQKNNSGFFSHFTTVKFMGKLHLKYVWTLKHNGKKIIMLLLWFLKEKGPKRVEERPSCRRMHLCFLVRGRMPMWETVFYVPQRASATSPPVQGYTKKSAQVCQLSLRFSFVSPPGNQGQANRPPSHCQINRLLTGVLSFKSSNSVGSHTLWNLGH